MSDSRMRDRKKTEKRRESIENDVIRDDEIKKENDVDEMKSTKKTKMNEKRRLFSMRISSFHFTSARISRDIKSFSLWSRSLSTVWFEMSLNCIDWIEHETD
jgi:hypothetical protein